MSDPLLRIVLSDGRTLTGWRTIPYLPVVFAYLLVAVILLLTAMIAVIPDLIIVALRERR